MGATITISVHWAIKALWEISSLIATGLLAFACSCLALSFTSLLLQSPFAEDVVQFTDIYFAPAIIAMLAIMTPWLLFFLHHDWKFWEGEGVKLEAK